MKNMVRNVHIVVISKALTHSSLAKSLLALNVIFLQTTPLLFIMLSIKIRKRYREKTLGLLLDRIKLQVLTLTGSEINVGEWCQQLNVV